MRDRELRRVAREFRQGIVDGVGGGSSQDLCFAVCYPLQGWLALCGLETDLVEADVGWTDHVWLALPDGRILDPTADQFGARGAELPPVYLGPLPALYQQWMTAAREEG